MACHLMTGSDFNQLRFFLHAAFRAMRAAVAERAARRKIQRTGRLTLDVFNFLGKVHLDIKDGIQQSL